MWSVPFFTKVAVPGRYTVSTSPSSVVTPGTSFPLMPYMISAELTCLGGQGFSGPHRTSEEDLPRPRYLFETSGGKPLGRESVSREIARAGRRILGKQISALSLRHAFATAAIKAGWSAKKVAAQLGHSSAAITLDMYVQDAPSWQDVAELWGDLSSREAECQNSTDR